MFEISSSPVRAVIVTPRVMSVPAFVMKSFEPLTTHAPSRSSARRSRRARVGAGVGLGQAERGELAPRREVGQPALLLLLGAEEEDRHRPEGRVRGDGDRDGRVDPRELLDRDRVREHVAARTSVLLWDRKAHQAELAELGDELVGEATLEVELRRDGLDALVGEVRTVSRMSSCSGGEVEVHGARMRMPRDRLRPFANRGGDASRWPACRSSSRGFRAASRPSASQGMNNTYVFDIDGAGVWTVTIADGAIAVERGRGGCGLHVLDERGELREDRRGRAEPDDRVHDREAQDQGRHGSGNEAPEALLERGERQMIWVADFSSAGASTSWP